MTKDGDPLSSWGLSGQDRSASPAGGSACASRSSTYGGAVPASSEIPDDVELSRILSAGLRAADAAGVRRVTLEHLPASDFAQLCDWTLAFLHEQPSSPSPMPEHRMVSARAAGVMPFWAAALGIVDDEEQRTRLRTLRMAVYDHLDDEARIVKEPGQGTPVHLPTRGTARQDEPEDALTPGAGFGTAELDRLVEQAAMEHVTSAYEADGWTVEDVSGRKVGWDVTCRRGSDERHVEVKGCSGSKPAVMLTVNELETAGRDPHWVLAVVVRAVVAPAMTEYGPAAVARAAAPSVFRVDLSGSR